jgi:hypothetical protein
MKETFALARQRIFRQALDLELPVGDESDEVRVYITRTQIRFSHASYTESVDSGLDMRGLTVPELQAAIQGWA